MNQPSSTEQPEDAHITLSLIVGCGVDTADDDSGPEPSGTNSQECPHYNRSTTLVEQVAGCRSESEALQLPLNTWSRCDIAEGRIDIEAGCLVSENRRMIASHVYEAGRSVRISLVSEQRT